MTDLREERGAALMMVLLAMVLMLILISAMFAVTRNEVVIASLHRDSARAFVDAQSGVEEALQRMRAGHPLQPGFRGSTGDVTVMVTNVEGDLYEIRSQAVAGRAQRRISHLIEMQTVAYPGDVLFGHAISEVGQSDIASGDVYARTFVQFREGEYGPGSSSGRLTHAGWRISRCVDPEKAPGGACKLDEIPQKTPPCYTHAQCVSYGEPTWYPGTRRTEYQSAALGADIAAQKSKCAAGGGGSLPSGIVPAGAIAADGTDIGGQPLYGFDRDDTTWNGTSITAQAVTGPLPCGLPYKWVSESFAWEKNDPPPTVTRWFKTIVFEEWFANYWTVDENGQPEKNSKLLTYPEFGAIPSFPAVDSLLYDEKRTGGGQLTESSGIDWGCKYPEMWASPPPPPSWCASEETRPRRIILEGGHWELTGNIKGHGTLIVTQSQSINIVSNFEYWGSILVDGGSSMTLGSGNVKIHGGGLITKQRINLGGNTLVEAGEGVPGAPTGLTIITARAWWER